MSQPEIDVLKQAEDFIRARQLPKAQRLLVDYIKKSPNSEQAWFLLSTAVDDPRKQVECLQRVLRINPANAEAQARLMKAMSAAAAPAPIAETKPTPASPAPVAQAPAREPAPYVAAAPTLAPAAEKSAPPAAPQPVEEPLVEIAKPIEPAPVAADTELSSLRAKIKKPRGPRKRWPRVLLLLLLVLLAAAVAGYILLNNLPAPLAVAPDTPAAVVEIEPTSTPAPTDTPTIALTPSNTPTRYPPTWTPTPPPTLPPTRTPTPLPTFEPGAQMALIRLQDSAAAVRGLKVEDDVPTVLIADDLVLPMLRTILNVPGRQAELQKQSQALAALSLVRPGFDLSRYTINQFVDDAGGFYVPWQDVMYVAGKDMAGAAAIVYGHHTVKGMLNQLYKFGRLGIDYPGCTLNTDRCHALTALIEGDVALTTDQWLAQDVPYIDDKARVAYAALPLAAPDPAASLFITRDLAFRREQGRDFVQALYRAGGWEAVNKAYEKLPASTEQILHPDKYLAGEAPIAAVAAPLTDTLGNDWQLNVDDVLGEWRTYLLLSSGMDEAVRLSAQTSRQAAAGWGGDRYQLYYNPRSDQTVQVVEWIWDTAEDAAEFAGSLNAYLDLRFRGAKTPQPVGECWSANRQTTCTYKTDKGTLWILAPDLSTIESIRLSYPAYK